MLAWAIGTVALSQQPAEQKKAGPRFEDGQAKMVDEFKDRSQWIRHDLWVETEFDSDGTGTPDRMHVSVVRQKQTDTEGLKVPVIYVSSPYFAGTAGSGKDYFWSPRQALGAEPPEHADPPFIEHQSRRPTISNSHTRQWVPRGLPWFIPNPRARDCLKVAPRLEAKMSLWRRKR